MLLSTTSLTLGPISYAADRVLEIALGCGVGMVVSILIAPSRAYTLSLNAAQEVTYLLAQRLEALSTYSCGSTSEIWVKVRRALAKLETLADEVARERRSRLSDDPDPEPLFRTPRRLRHDVATWDRMLGQPLPAAIERQLARPWSYVAMTTAGILRDTGRALAERRMPQQAESVSSAIQAYVAATEEAGRNLTRGFSTESVGRIFGIVFALEQLRMDLEDLINRERESSRTGGQVETLEANAPRSDKAEA